MTRQQIIEYLENEHQEVEILGDAIIIRTKEQKNYNICNLKQELINYLTKKIINDNVFNECDVEIIKILFENEKTR